MNEMTKGEKRKGWRFKKGAINQYNVISQSEQLVSGT